MVHYARIRVHKRYTDRFSKFDKFPKFDKFDKFDKFGSVWGWRTVGNRARGKVLCVHVWCERVSECAS